MSDIGTEAPAQRLAPTPVAAPLLRTRSKMAKSPVGRLIWFSFGWLMMGLAALGAILPLLPTAPFLLVAAWAFGKSSERWRNWIYNQPTFGPIVIAWEDHRVIPLLGKVAAFVTMASSFAALVILDRLPVWGLVAVGVLLFAVAIYIWRHPSHPPKPAPEAAPSEAGA